MSSAYEGLPIFRDATRLVAYLEIVVMGFPRYHKYAIGTDIRKLSYEILDLVREANIKINRVEKLRSAMNHIQKLKSRLQVCFELKVFRNPNSFPTAIQKAEVDDFVILSPDAAELSAYRARIEEFLAKQLNLRLHPTRRKLLPISNGIDFLGYIIRPGYILVRRRVVNNLKEKFRQFRMAKVKDLKKLHDSVASYTGHFKWANSYRLNKSLVLERSW